MWYALDLAEVAGLSVIVVGLLRDRFRLQSYFSGRIGGGVGSDAFMMSLVLVLVVCIAAYAIIRGKVWVRRNGRSVQGANMAWADLRKPACVLGCTVVYVVLIPVAGYGLASLVFFSLFSRLESNRLAVNLTHGVLMAAACYLTFQVILGIPFPRGLLW